MEIKYNTPIQVNPQQYHAVMYQFQGCVAGRELQGQYWIKVWLMRNARGITNLLNSLQK